MEIDGGVRRSSRIVFGFDETTRNRDFDIAYRPLVLSEPIFSRCTHLYNSDFFFFHHFPHEYPSATMAWV